MRTNRLSVGTVGTPCRRLFAVAALAAMLLATGCAGLMPRAELQPGWTIAGKPTGLPQIADGPFQATTDSLKQFQCPEWFRDAKLGIFLHWDPQSVGEFGDWYARRIYDPASRYYAYHMNKYGHVSKFGYKDIIELWKAEKFDPGRLVARFKAAGARYIVPVAVHHDNFDNWNSKHHPWNAVKHGPHKDIVGLWRAATLEAGLRFGVSEHLARSWSWMQLSHGADKTGPHAGVPYDGADPRYEELYFPPAAESGTRFPRTPPDWWKREWVDRVMDLVDNYRPDLLYTDGGIAFEEYGRSLIAHFYNRNIQWHGGRLEGVYNLKHMPVDHGAFADGIAVQDVERGVLAGLRPQPWQTDTCIGEWHYHAGIKYKSAERIVTMLVDIVSKNGNLLLNIPLKPDGSLDADEEKFLDDMTAWIGVGGEAIFDTRPWSQFAEGTTRAAGGSFADRGDLAYSAEDFRFTTKGETLYAIALGWPASGTWTIKSLAAGSPDYPKEIGRVELLGSDAALKWTRTAEGLVVQAPARRPCEYAWAFKITPKD